MKEILELKQVHYTYHTPDGETEALHDVSFRVTEGEFIAIVGPSGCGNEMCDKRKQTDSLPAVSRFSSSTISKENVGVLSIPHNLIQHHFKICSFFRYA